jgi:hypothetical protein
MTQADGDYVARKPRESHGLTNDPPLSVPVTRRTVAAKAVAMSFILLNAVNLSHQVLKT